MRALQKAAEICGKSGLIDPVFSYYVLLVLLKRGHESASHGLSREAWPMLTVVEIRALKPAGKPYRIPDFDGLLVQQPSEALLWRFRYKMFG
jgi:hypothetical protein